MLRLVGLSLLLLGAAQAQGQRILWERSKTYNDLAHVDFRCPAVKLGDSIIVVAGRLDEYGMRDPISQDWYDRDCLIWISTRNLWEPKITLLPSYFSAVALTLLRGEIHGFSQNSVTHEMVYFKASYPRGLIDSALFVRPSWASTRFGYFDFENAQPLTNGQIAVVARNDLQSDYPVWLGVFDSKIKDWKWEGYPIDTRFLPSQLSTSFAIPDGRAVFTGTRGLSVVYTVVDSLGFTPLHTLWRSPDSTTTTYLNSGSAMPRADGGWLIQSDQRNVTTNAYLDSNLNTTYSGHAGLSFLFPLKDNGIFTIKDINRNYRINYCKLTSSLQEEWCYDAYPRYDYGIMGNAIPIDSNRILFVANDFESIRIACFSGIGDIYDPVQDTALFPPTAIHSIEKSVIKLQAYPNPATSYLTIEGKPRQQVILYTMQGTWVTETMLDNQGRGRIDLSPLPKGMYILWQGEQRIKLMKE